MALSQATNLVEKITGHTGDATTIQDVTNPDRDRARFADPSGEKMQALVWNGKNSVKVGEWFKPPSMPKHNEADPNSSRNIQAKDH